MINAFTKAGACCFILLVLVSCNSNDTFEARKHVAKEMLDKKCDIIVNASTEFIREKHPVIAMGVGFVASSKCDCITDSLAIQFANDYDLEKLEELKSAPIESLQLTIEKLMSKNDAMVLHCLEKW